MSPSIGEPSEHTQTTNMQNIARYFLEYLFLKASLKFVDKFTSACWYALPFTDLVVSHSDQLQSIAGDGIPRVNQMFTDEVAKLI